MYAQPSVQNICSLLQCEIHHISAQCEPATEHLTQPNRAHFRYILRCVIYKFHNRMPYRIFIIYILWQMGHIFTSFSYNFVAHWFHEGSISQHNYSAIRKTRTTTSVVNKVSSLTVLVQCIPCTLANGGFASAFHAKFFWVLLTTRERHAARAPLVLTLRFILKQPIFTPSTPTTSVAQHIVWERRHKFRHRIVPKCNRQRSKKCIFQ